MYGTANRGFLVDQQTADKRQEIAEVPQVMTRRVMQNFRHSLQLNVENGDDF